MILSTIISSVVAGMLSLFGNSHDVTTLPSWGPYAKQYAGISKVSDVDSGVRVDFSLMPGMYRRNVCVPNLLFESGCYPWQVSADLSTITYRYELEWKDRVYLDATYHVMDDSNVLLEMHCVNATDQPQDITLHTIASIAAAEQYPEFRTDSRLIPAVRYVSYEPKTRKHNYALVYDGWLRGEARDPQTLTGSALKTSGEAGDVIVYDLGDYSGEISLRLRTDAKAPVRISVNGKEVLAGSDSFSLCAAGTQSGLLRIETLSEGSVYLDAVILSGNPEIRRTPLNRTPSVEIAEGSYVLKYDDDPLWYGVGWNFPTSDVLQYCGSNLDVLIRRKVHDHVNSILVGEGDEHYTSAFQRPVCLQPQSDTTVWNIISCGSRESVKAALSEFRKNEVSITSKVSTACVGNSKQLLPGAEKYALGQQLMQATVMTDIVYPVYTQGQYIRHFTPGKNWNSLYTWDSGFICWGLTDLDPVKAFEIIRAYTTEEGSQSFFIHHGTPLPIHIFAFSQLLSRLDDSDAAAFLYPRLKRMYEFISGHEAASTMKMPSGLIRTWDYFYNSGGWDDYPPQKDLVSHPELYPSVAPMVSTSYCIRAARILRLYAQRMSIKADVKMYDADIASMRKAVLDNAWDAEKGYFGYVTHDASGKPDGLYRTPDGVDYNMGLDGVSPLVAGICDEQTRNTLVGHIFNPSELWTSVGISTVDQSAPYFSISGYWNGCVWMPHQFVLWKTMLDLGREDLAEKIAQTALDVWAGETAETYQCYEQFMIKSGRGKGWHNFSGLSAPILNWFAAYYKTGTLSSGFDVLATDVRFGTGCDSCTATLSFDKDAIGRQKCLILCMDPSKTYSATLGGRPVKLSSPRPGLVYLHLTAVKGNQTLCVTSE